MINPTMSITTVVFIPVVRSNFISRSWALKSPRNLIGIAQWSRIYPSSKCTFRHTIACDGFSSIINHSLIRQNRVPYSDPNTSFRQQNVTFQCKMTSIIRQNENVAKYFRSFSHARHTDMLSVMVN